MNAINKLNALADVVNIHVRQRGTTTLLTKLSKYYTPDNDIAEHIIVSSNVKMSNHIAANSNVNAMRAITLQQLLNGNATKGLNWPVIFDNDAIAEIVIIGTQAILSCESICKSQLRWTLAYIDATNAVNNAQQRYSMCLQDKPSKWQEFINGTKWREWTERKRACYVTLINTQRIVQQFTIPTDTTGNIFDVFTKFKAQSPYGLYGSKPINL